MTSSASTGRGLDVVCCSLEPWDDVWRRNQFLVSELLKLDPQLRILFVEPPTDVPWLVKHRMPIRDGGLRRVGSSGRLWAVAFRKWLPRRISGQVDLRLGRQAANVAMRLGFDRPILWINDSSHAALVKESGWPTVYDITDDWLMMPYPPRHLDRRRQNEEALLRMSTEVVVCSTALERSRGAERPVRLIPNGVDVAHFRRPAERPEDLAHGPVVLYTGTLHGQRLDVDLCVDLAEQLTGRARLVFVGPNACYRSETTRLEDAGALLLGPRSYEVLPAYMQHASVLVVPHLVNPFTESLDPLKAREMLAVGRPAVTTPVAGLRDQGPPIRVAERHEFVSKVLGLLDDGDRPPGAGPMITEPGSWSARAGEFLGVLQSAADASELACGRTLSMSGGTR